MMSRGRLPSAAQAAWWLLSGLTAGMCLFTAELRPVGATQMAPADALSPAIEAAFGGPGLRQIDETPVNTFDLRPVYAHRGYTPLWIAASGTADERIQGVVGVLAEAASEGLNPQWYHVEAIRRRLGTSDSAEIVRLELLLSDGALRYALHQKRGASPPAPGDPEMAFDEPRIDPEGVLLAITSAPDPADYLRSLGPIDEGYRHLRTALALYRRIEKDGGWAVIPDGPALRLGMSSGAVPLARRRLAVTGEFESAARGSSRYDAALAAAVKRFQQRNGIAADGVLGAATRQALNVTVDRRIEQIVVNMERRRWINPAPGGRYVKVNVPAFTLDVVDSGQAVLSMPVVVGKTTQRTPMFSSEIRRLVFNPSWLVPPKIAREEIIPKAREDAHYLSREGYSVRRVRARPATPRDDGQTRGAMTSLRQAPGPRNPLGRVKFIMPNVFGVYLHDTPSHQSFSRQTRTLSHGCVRLGKALALVDALMTETDNWNDERRQHLLSTWETHSITLTKPLPVHVLYETAWSEASGLLHFRPDIYGRDETLARQMAEPRILRPGSVVRRAPDAQAVVAAP